MAFAKTEKLLRDRRKTYRMHLARQSGETVDPAHFELDETSMDHNYLRHYKAVLDACAAIRIWTVQSISPDEARRAQALHARACRAWSLMHCHLTPYFHLLTHGDLFIYRLGPVYNFWLFGPESNNGRLVKVNTNGHTGGELEGTMMRSWVKNILMYDLVSRLHFPRVLYSAKFDIEVRAMEDLQEKTQVDNAVIKKLRNYLKGDHKIHRTRDSLLNMIASRGQREEAIGELSAI